MLPYFVILQTLLTICITVEFCKRLQREAESVMSAGKTDIPQQRRYKNVIFPFRIYTKDKEYKTYENIIKILEYHRCLSSSESTFNCDQYPE